MVFDRVCLGRQYEIIYRKFRQVIGIYLSIIILLEVFLITALTEMGLPTFKAGALAKTIRMAISSSAHMIPALQSIFLRNISVSLVLTSLTLFTLFAANRIKMLRSAVPFFLIFLTIISAWYFTNKSLYAGERMFVYPQNDLISELQRRAGLYRISTANVLSKIRAESNAVYGLYSPEGLNPVYPYRYGQLVQSSVNGGVLTNNISRLSVDLNLEQASWDASAAARVKRLIALLGVKYITEKKETGWYAKIFPTHTQVWENPYFRIWENPDVLPRAFVATDIKVIKDSQKILDALYNPKTNLRDTAIVEQPVEISASINTNNSVSIDLYRMNNVTMTVHSSTSGLLVLTDTYAPGWHAVIDGKEIPVYRTDFAFRGVPISAGDHTVFLYYRPQSFVIGLWGMAGGILLLLGCISVPYLFDPRSG